MKLNKKAFTVVEMIVATAIFGLVMSMVYGFLIHGVSSNEKGIKNIDAIQDMAFIIHNLRSDLRTLIEFNEDKESYIIFDKASKSLKFTAVSGVSDQGVVLYSQILYYFDKKALYKKFHLMKDENTMGDETVYELAKMNKIKDLHFEICDSEGKPVSSSPEIRAAKPPKLLKARIIHSSNARLEVNISLYSTYIKPKNTADNYWVLASKVIPMDMKFDAITPCAEFEIDTAGNPSTAVTRRGIRVGRNMGIPSSGQNVPDGEQ